MLTLLPLPFFMDSEGDVAVSVSSLLCSFVSHVTGTGKEEP